MEKRRKYFGTDGIRGKVGHIPITPDFVLKIGFAIGIVLKEHYKGNTSNTVLIGKDTRLSGYMLEAALESGLAAAGINTCLLGPIPTPAVSYLTQYVRALAGIVISASHNPYYDNGIKIFSCDGLKLPDELEEKIEQKLAEPLEVVSADKIGRVNHIADLNDNYFKFCLARFSNLTTMQSLSKLKIILDCANGATYKIAPKIFSHLGFQVKTIACEPDGLNINHKCGATSTDLLKEAVLKEKADIGIAFDGDGDRVIMIDHLGETVDGDQLLFIIIDYLHKTGEFYGGVVGTAMTNFGFEQAMQHVNIPFVRTKVGDRYILSELLQRQWKYGCETSGHIILMDNSPTGDGILAALKVLSVISFSNKSLHELKSKMHKLPQHMINIKLKNKIDLVNNEHIQKEKNEIDKILSGRGRVVLRKSGTEPLLRIMVESEDANEAVLLANRLAVAAQEN